MIRRIWISTLYVILTSTHAISHAQTEVDPAPSGVERNVIEIDNDTGDMIGKPGRDAGEERGATIDFTKDTDVGNARDIRDFDPDTTTIEFEDN